MIFGKSEWIWWNKTAKNDEFAEFYASLFINNVNGIICNISVDSDYALYINGKYVASNQYGDFSYYKVYDSLDIASFLKEGENHFAVVAWHFGGASQRYAPAPAGLIFEIVQGENILLYSDKNTLSRKSKAYVSWKEKLITRQLGYSFRYEADKEDDWKLGVLDGFSSSVVVEKEREFFKRPILKHNILSKTESMVVEKSNDGCHYLIDLLKEVVGLPLLQFTAEDDCEILVAYGEHIEDGNVRRLIQDRDFSFEYRAIKGKNEYFHPFLRLGCRYLEVFSDKPIELEYIGVCPQVYPVQGKKYTIDNSLDREIYELSYNTLNLCMMEHYVDCPWREQDLYVFDSRNQMLYGYYAFENGNADYARANLLLMAQDRREDGLFPICFPTLNVLTIPSFSLYYFVALKEYLAHTGDTTLIEAVLPRAEKILVEFQSTFKDGLYCRRVGNTHWNFYDWTDYMCAGPEPTDKPIPDAAINCIMILALEAYYEIAEKIGKKQDRTAVEALKKEVKQSFYNTDDACVSLYKEKKIYLKLVNALALLTLDFSTEEKETICEKLIGDDLIETTLSTCGFKYDALLQNNLEKYKNYVLEDIRRNYSKMLNAGATSAWETLDGASAFDNAGSLCHGWSALPILYFKQLGILKEET